MDQEFEDSSEEKLRNEDEHQEQGPGVDQGGGLGQDEGEGLGQGQDEEEDEDDGHGKSLGQGQVQVQSQSQGQVQGEGEGQVQVQGRGHLFGRQKPVHSALGGGTRIFSISILSYILLLTPLYLRRRQTSPAADVILWRNKQMSAALLAGSTVIWLLFEWIGYHLIPFICHFLILTLASLFLWSNLSFYVHKSTLNFPEIELPHDLCMTVALLLRDRCNQAISMLWEVASGKDLKRFLTAIFALWVVSIVGSWFDFLTIVYIINVLILTMPPLYEKHEDQVDSYAQKAKAKLKRQYSKLDERVLQKLPKVPFISDNKQH